MLRKQEPIFSHYWLSLPAQGALEEVNTDALPLMATKLVNEVKNADDFGRFLQDAKTRIKLQEEIAALIQRFEQRLQSLWKANDKEILKIKEELQFLKKKFEYQGSNPITNKEYLIPYREGIPLLFNVLNLIEKGAFSEDFLKTTVITLFEGMDFCFPGIHTRAFYAWMQLAAPSPERQLLNIRQEIAKKEVLLRLRQHPIMQEPEMEGNEIHFVTSILNYFSKSFGLLEIKDSYAIDISSDTNPYPTSQNAYHWFEALKTIAKEVAPILTPRTVFEHLAENIAGEIRTLPNNAEHFDKITELLNRYGSAPDEEFHIGYHILTETGELQPEWELLQNIRMTLLKRFNPNKGRGVEKTYPITATVTLHPFTDESFNYVVEASLLGSPPRLMPLSNYLLKAATGTPYP